MLKKDISVSDFILPQVKIANTDAVRMYTVADNRVRTRYGIGGQHNKIGIVFTQFQPADILACLSAMQYMRSVKGLLGCRLESGFSVSGGIISPSLFQSIKSVEE